MFATVLFYDCGKWDDFDSLLLYFGNHLFEGFDRGGMGVANPDRLSV